MLNSTQSCPVADYDRAIGTLSFRFVRLFLANALGEIRRYIQMSRNFALGMDEDLGQHFVSAVILCQVEFELGSEPVKIVGGWIYPFLTLRHFLAASGTFRAHRIIVHFIEHYKFWFLLHSEVSSAAH
jgi:hypothetical protein